MEEENAGKLLALKLQKDEAESKIRQAVHLLFAMAGLNVALGIYLWFQVNSQFILWGAFIVSLLLGVLGYWANTKPALPLIISIFLLVGFYAAQLAVSPSFSLVGVAARLTILVFLIVGVINVSKAQKVVRKYNELKNH